MPGKLLGLGVWTMPLSLHIPGFRDTPGHSRNGSASVPMVPPGRGSACSPTPSTPSQAVKEPGCPDSHDVLISADGCWQGPAGGGPGARCQVGLAPGSLLAAEAEVAVASHCQGPTATDGGGMGCLAVTRSTSQGGASQAPGVPGEAGPPARASWEGGSLHGFLPSGPTALAQLPAHGSSPDPPQVFGHSRW